jgi:hypothetical protein
MLIIIGIHRKSFLYRRSSSSITFASTKSATERSRVLSSPSPFLEDEEERSYSMVSMDNNVSQQYEDTIADFDAAGARLTKVNSSVRGRLHSRFSRLLSRP